MSPVSDVENSLEGFRGNLYSKRSFPSISMSSLVRKARKLMLLVLAAPVVVIVRLLSPFVLVRFGGLKSARLGHLALNTELYTCEMDAGLDQRRTLDVFYHGSTVCNRQLRKMWDRTLHVHTFARHVDWLNRRLPGGGIHEITLPTDRDEHQLLGRTRSHISFTTDERDAGSKALSDLGVPEGASFICFHSRDSAYLESLRPGHNWGYHDYRETDVSNFVPAAEEMGRRGYHSLRVGAVIRDAVASDDPRVIDYAVDGRSDFMDIYLVANCRFFLCSSSGLMGLANTFRVPLAYVDVVPLEYTPPGARDLFIPKKLWLREEGRFLTFRETLSSGAGRFLRSDQFQALGVELVENTPEEVCALAVEMEERLRGTWQSGEENENLQGRYWALFNPTHVCYGSPARIGTEFLRQNRELLE